MPRVRALRSTHLLTAGLSQRVWVLPILTVTYHEATMALLVLTARAEDRVIRLP
jgi:hypothetical protein